MFCSDWRAQQINSTVRRLRCDSNRKTCAHVEATSNIACVLLLMLALVSVRADSYSPYKLEFIKNHSRTTDLLAIVEVKSISVGQRGYYDKAKDVGVETTDTKIVCTVRKVAVGDSRLAGSTIIVVFSAADDPIAGATDEARLMFLKRDGENWTTVIT